MDSASNAVRILEDVDTLLPGADMIVEMSSRLFGEVESMANWQGVVGYG